MNKDADLLNLPSIDDLINDDTNTVDNDISDSIGDEDIFTLDISEDTTSDVNDDVNESVDNTDEMDDEVEHIILSADVYIWRKRKKNLDSDCTYKHGVFDEDYVNNDINFYKFFCSVDQGLHKLYNVDNFYLLHDFEVGTDFRVQLGDDVFMNNLIQVLNIDLNTYGCPYTLDQKTFSKFWKMLYTLTYNDIFGLSTGFIPLNMSIHGELNGFKEYHDIPYMDVLVLNNGINVLNDKSCGSLENALIEFFTRKGVTIDPLRSTEYLKTQFENYVIATLYKNAQIAFEKVYPDKKVLFVTDAGTQMNLNLIDLN